MKSKKLNYYLTFVVLFAVLLVSCKKDEDKPAYVGTWTATNPSTIFSYKTTLIINENSFTYTNYLKVEGVTEWLEKYAFKGDLNVTGKEMTIEATSFAESVITIGTTVQSTDLKWYNKGTTEFSALLNDYEMSSTMKLQFIVDGNSLTIIPDYNNDGTLDTDETQVYTKE